MPRNQLNLRDVALICLSDIEKGAHIQEILDNRLKKLSLAEADRRLLTDLVSGCLRNNLRLEHILRSLLPKPENLPPKLRKLFLLALYSLFFQDKIPAYAVVNESVKIAVKNFGQKMGNLVNAVLRKALALEGKPENLEWYAEKMPFWEAQCVFYGVPKAIASMWRNAYGEDAAACLMRRSGGRPWSALRFNASMQRAREICDSLKEGKARKKLSQWAWAFAPGETPAEIAGCSVAALESQGIVSRQSPASILLCEKLGLYEWRKPVWDCCAGSGIKLAALLERGVSVRLASDVSVRRLENISPFCSRLGLESPLIVRASAERPPLRRWEGNIIADVPCSGLGTLARRPDIRLNFLNSAGKLKNHVQQQARILNAIGRLPRKGFKLAYITCTLNPDENERQIRKFMKLFPDFALLAEWQTPHNHPWLEGMYGAVLERL